MKLRKRVVGDLYLSASIIFIFLAFLYFGFGLTAGWAFLIIGLAVAVFGMHTKDALQKQETAEAALAKRSAPAGRQRKASRRVTARKAAARAAPKAKKKAKKKKGKARR